MVWNIFQLPILFLALLIAVFERTPCITSIFKNKLSTVFFFSTCFLFPCAFLAQTTNNLSESYIQVYGGLGIQGSVNIEQIGVAHKRGDFNEFDTDFNLNVRVNGKSDLVNFYTTGFVMGHIWEKSNRKWSPGFELDVNRTFGKFNSTLVNQENQEVSNINGANGADVIGLVHEYYGAGRHNFSNTMNMETWNVSGNFIVTLHIHPTTSIYTGLGFGFSGVLLKDAESLQTSPADSPPGYETTTDNGGGPVNHFNGQPNASSILLFGQARLGTKIDLSQKIAFIIDTRVFCRGAGDFTFGSTQYTDHAPTDHWRYSIAKGVGIMLNIGVVFSL